MEKASKHMKWADRKRPPPLQFRVGDQVLKIEVRTNQIPQSKEPKTCQKVRKIDRSSQEDRVYILQVGIAHMHENPPSNSCEQPKTLPPQSR